MRHRARIRIRSAVPNRDAIAGSTGAIVALLVLAAALRLLLLVAVPPDESDREAFFVGFNDEPAHYNYVRYLAEHRRFPVQSASITDPDAFEADAFEYYQAPLYYLAALPFRAVARRLCEGCGLYGVRLLSVALSLLQIWLIHRFVVRFVRIPEAAVGIPLFFALLLGHARFSAQANNDALLWLVCLAFFYLLYAVVAAGGGTVRDWAGLGAVAGLGILAKTSFVTLLAAAPLALLIERRDRSAVGRISAYVGGSLLLAGPWLARNKLVYGEWLATSVGVGEGRTAVDAGFLSRVWNHHLAMLPFQFWSGFENTYSRAAQQNVMKLLLVLSLVAGAVATRYWLRRFKSRDWEPGERAFGWAVVVASAGNLAGFVIYGFRYSQTEVRLLFPSSTLR